MTRIADILRRSDWIDRVRVGGVVFVVVELGVFNQDYRPGDEARAWALTAVFAAGAVVLLAGGATPRAIALALVFDTGVVATFALLFVHEYGSPTRWALNLVVVEAALRYGRRGGVLMPIALLPFLTYAEWLRADRYGPPDFLADRVSFPFGIFLLTGLIVGWLVERLELEASHASVRAMEAERLRDELGRRVDLLDAANRCGRALAGSLDPTQAFDAFTRELRGLVPFDRMMVMRQEEGISRIVATAGLGADVWPVGGVHPRIGAIVAQVLDGSTQVREDMLVGTADEERELVALGLRSRVVAPLQAGARTLGFFSLSRVAPDAFTSEEVELVTLLGRLVATAVQNIRAYEAERTTVEELRRLSALRADFVSVVSHELRSPMAAVIGAARTLDQRWRELRPEQREAFLAVIGDETSRLAHLIEDVLDSSRIDAGTFSYRFASIDLAALARDAVATASLAQDEVLVRVEVLGGLPAIRGDGERLRQLLDNLVSNAVKYSEAGQEVEVTLAGGNGNPIRLAVTDHGPGIAPENQRLIFEKFGRVTGSGSKPGTGLGLFIARSIAEAHGGALDVHSAPGHGTTFVLTLPP